MSKIPRSKRNTKQSPWRKLRAQHLRVYPECRICSDTSASNHVHHLRYRGRKGIDEQPGDLITLCQFHHNELHREVNFRKGGKLVQGTLDFIEAKSVELSYVMF